MQQRDVNGHFLPVDFDPAAPALPAGALRPRSAAAIAAQEKRKRRKTGRTQYIKHFKVHQVLTSEQRREFDRLCRDPASTGNTLQVWLVERGAKVSRNSIDAYRRHVLLDREDVKTASLLARGFLKSLGRERADLMPEAAQRKFEQLFTGRLFQMEPTDPMSALDWNRIARSITSLIANHKEMQTLPGVAAVAEAKPVNPAGELSTSAVDAIHRMLGLGEPQDENGRDSEPRRPMGAGDGWDGARRDPSSG